MLTKQQIEVIEFSEKVEELRGKYIKDDGFFGDALYECFAELRAMFNAKNLDDKLAAIDAFQSKMKSEIREESKLEEEAEGALMGFRESPTKMFERENASMFAA